MTHIDRPGYCTAKQRWLIEKLGSDLGYTTGDDVNMSHVLFAVSAGRREHWASVKVYEASTYIKRLKGGMLGPKVADTQ